MSENTAQSASLKLEFSTFTVGSALFGINILNIQEINRIFDITRVPQSSDYIEGILNLRGRIVTIIDLGKKLGLSPVKKHRDNRNIIINSGGEYIGLLVDAISDVVSAGKNDIEPAPANIGGIKAKFFHGVLKTEKQLIGVLNIDEVISE